MNKEISRKIGEWLISGQTGCSSTYMAGIMLGADTETKSRWGASYPHDPSDFGRCLRLIEAVPEIKEHLHLMKECGEVWSKLVDNWDEMTRLYQRDLDTGRSEDLYLLMKSLGT